MMFIFLCSMVDKRFAIKNIISEIDSIQTALSTLRRNSLLSSYITNV